MTIESTLERIADALEILANNQGASEVKITKNPTKTASKKKAEPAVEPEEKTEEPAPEAPAAPVTIDAVRNALKDLQKATNAATAKGVLSDFGVGTLSELDDDQYPAVIAAAEKAAI